MGGEHFVDYDELRFAHRVSSIMREHGLLLADALVTIRYEGFKEEPDGDSAVWDWLSEAEANGPRAGLGKELDRRLDDGRRDY
jgi:hypothetical protein